MFVRFFGGEAKNIFGDSCLQASHGYVPALQFGACSNVYPVVVNPMLVSTLHCPSLSGRHCAAAVVVNSCRESRHYLNTPGPSCGPATPAATGNCFPKSIVLLLFQ